MRLLGAVSGIETMPEAEFKVRGATVKANLTRKGVDLFGTHIPCLPKQGQSDLGHCEPLSGTFSSATASVYSGCIWSL